MWRAGARCQVGAEHERAANNQTAGDRRRVCFKTEPGAVNWLLFAVKIGECLRVEHDSYRTKQTNLSGFGDT